MRVGGKITTKKRTGIQEVDDVLHKYYAARNLEKRRAKDGQWRMAQACASDRRLLIGNCKIFRSPR